MPRSVVARLLAAWQGEPDQPLIQSLRQRGVSGLSPGVGAQRVAAVLNGVPRNLYVHGSVARVLAARGRVMAATMTENPLGNPREYERLGRMALAAGSDAWSAAVYSSLPVTEQPGRTPNYNPGGLTYTPNSSQPGVLILNTAKIEVIRAYGSADEARREILHVWATAYGPRIRHIIARETPDTGLRIARAWAGACAWSRWKHGIYARAPEYYTRNNLHRWESVFTALGGT